MRGEDYPYSVLSLCMCVFAMDGGPAGPSVCDRGSADSDRPLHTHTVSRICWPRDQQIRDTEWLLEEEEVVMIA